MFMQVNEAEILRFKSCRLIVEYEFHISVVRRLPKNITTKMYFLRMGIEISRGTLDQPANAAASL